MNMTELPSNGTSLLLTDLMPFTVYSITVAGSTSAGRGEFTTPVTMRTRIDSEWKMGLDNVCVYLSVNAVRALGMEGFCLVQGVHDYKTAK